MQIKDVPEEERPFEKANKYGIDTLSNQELLAVILRVGVKDSSVLDISIQVLNLIYNNDICMQNLLKIKGISKVKAIKILALEEFSRRYNKMTKNDSVSFENAFKIYSYYKDIMNDKKQEKFVILYLNKKRELLHEKTMFLGSADTSVIDIKLILSKALQIGSSKMVCMHNHPSGNTTPSENDLITTEQIKYVSKIMGIDLVDHLIFGNGYYSFAENGKL